MVNAGKSGGVHTTHYLVNCFLPWKSIVDFRKKIQTDASIKPCHTLKYCPYGPLAEVMPQLNQKDEPDIKTCLVFRHMCPVYRYGQPLSECQGKGEG